MKLQDLGGNITNQLFMMLLEMCSSYFLCQGIFRYLESRAVFAIEAFSN